MIRNVSLALMFLLMILITIIEWRQSLVVVDQEFISQEEIDSNLEEWKEMEKKIPRLNDDDIVEVFYLEHLLASWVLQKSPWNAFHSGIGFIVRDKTTNKKTATYSFDFTPMFTDTVSYVLHPVITPIYPSWMPHIFGLVYARIFNEYDMLWQNHGGTRYRVGIPDKFTNFTQVGVTDGKIFNKFFNWLKEYDETHKTFEPVEIVINGTTEGGIGSSMCHDLFYNALHAMKKFGFEPEPKDYIFRDHIMVFADTYEEVDINDPVVRKDVIRYYRLFMHFMELINQEFTNIRNLLVNANSVSIQPYLFLGEKYYKINLVPPYVNYCYLAVEMPPAKASVWHSEHLCALEQSVSTTPKNSTLFEAITDGKNLFYVLDSIVDDPIVWTTLLAIFLISLVFKI